MSGWSARRPSTSRSPTRRTPFSASSASWAAGTARWPRKRRWSRTRSSAAPEDFVKVKVRGKEYTPGADLRVHPPGPEEDRRGLPRREGHRRGDHRAGVLQRRPAQGDQGRRRDRGAEGPARAARADRGRARVRAGQEEEREDPRLRPRRRHVRRVGARRRRRRLRGAVDQRQHAPRRRRLRRGADQLRRRGVPQAGRHRPPQGPDGPAAAEGSRARRRRSSSPTRWRPRSTCRSSPPTRTAPSTCRSRSRGRSSSS